MIHTARQLKALVRNRSNSDSKKAQTLIRIYTMERFLERLSVSKYRDNFILKGGILVSSMVGVDRRSTMDIILFGGSGPVPADFDGVKTCIAEQRAH